MRVILRNSWCKLPLDGLFLRPVGRSLRLAGRPLSHCGKKNRANVTGHRNRLATLSPSTCVCVCCKFHSLFVSCRNRRHSVLGKRPDFRPLSSTSSNGLHFNLTELLVASVCLSASWPRKRTREPGVPCCCCRRRRRYFLWLCNNNKLDSSYSRSGRHWLAVFCGRGAPVVFVVFARWPGERDCTEIWSKLLLARSNTKLSPGQQHLLIVHSRGQQKMRFVNRHDR